MLSKNVLCHSIQGDSTDYDMEGDTRMQEMLAEMPPLAVLPLALSLPQLPAAASGAGQQLLLPPPPPTLPPTTSGAGQGLLRKALHMPPASDAEQAGCSKQLLSPGVQSLLDTHADWQRKAEEQKVQKKKKKEGPKKADRPLLVLPGMVPPKPSADPLTAEQI